MNKSIQSLFMVLLLVFAAVPSYALTYADDEICDGVADGTVAAPDDCNACTCKGGELIGCTEMACLDNDMVIVSDGVSGDIPPIGADPYIGIGDEDLVSRLKELKAELRSRAFWLNTGESRTFNPNANTDFKVTVEYQGTEGSGSSICEAFGVNYQDGSVYLPSQVFETSAEEYGVVAVESKSGEVPGTAGYVRELHEPVTVVVNEGNVEDILEPTGVTDELIGAEAVDGIVDADVIGVPEKDITDEERRKLISLEERLYVLAEKVGGEIYVRFVSSDIDVVNALADFLIREKNLRRDNHVDFEEFKKLNKIDKKYQEMFFNLVKHARQEMAHAQINGFKSLLALQENNLKEAEKYYEKAMQHYGKYQDWMAKVDTEIWGWKPLPPRTDGKLPPEDTGWGEALCINKDDLGFSIFLYEKDADKVLVAYNPESQGIYYGPDQEYVGGGVGIPVDAVITDIVEPKEPVADEAQGCKMNGKRMPVGTRFIAEQDDQELPMYCDWTGKTFQQKEVGEKASNSYECRSGEERNGTCQDTLNFLQKIWKSVLSIFG